MKHIIFFIVVFAAALFLSCASKPKIEEYTLTLTVLEDGEAYTGQALNFLLKSTAPVLLPGEEEASYLEYTLLPPDEENVSMYSAVVVPGEYHLFEGENDLHAFIFVDAEKNNAVVSYCSTVGALASSLSDFAAPSGMVIFVSDKTFSALGYNNLMQRSLSAATCPVSLSLEDCPKITTMGYQSFYSCASLVSLILPNKITAIPKDTFFACSSLRYIQIPKNVTTIEGGAFYACTSLSDIDFDKGNTNFYVDGGALFSSNKKTLIAFPSAFGDVKVADGVETIEKYAFAGCSALKSVSLNGANTVRSFAFYNCQSLSKISILEATERIEKNAFRLCTSLSSFSVASSNKAYSANGALLLSKDSSVLYAWPSASGKITIPSGIRKVEANAFEAQEKISAVVFAPSVKEIGHKAFFACKDIASIEFSSVEKISSFAFAGLTALRSVTFPKTLRQIEGSSFSQCVALESIVVAPENEYYSAEGGSLFSFDKKMLVLYPSAKDVLEIPDFVENIGSYAFHCCSALTEVSMPNVRNIGHYAFDSCSGLQKITLPTSLETIGCYAFCGCQNVLELYLSQNVNSVQNNAFWFWTNNQRILCGARSRPATWSDAWNAGSEALVEWNKRL